MDSGEGIALREAAAWTPAGDATATAEFLRAGKVLLRALPVDGSEGSIAPIALDNPMTESVPPRWWKRLKTFARPVAQNNWGTLRRPVLVTSSNYGVGSLLAFRESGEHGHLAWGTPHAAVARISEAFGWGPNVTLFSHACVSAQLGLVQAERLLRADLADEVLVFSFDFLSPFVVGGFHSLKILNEQFPRPYTDCATGSIGLGDGAAYAVLARGTPADGKPLIHSQGLHNELAHFTANRSDGSGFRALLEPFPIAGKRLWVKGHGTGTLEAGRLESAAVAQAAPGAPLVSWKGSLGHTLGSCALVELVIALAAIGHGWIPGTVGAGDKTFTPSVAREPFPAADFDAVLLLSNAFGGAHGGMLVTYA